MQEKLQHFYKVSLESAQEEAQNEIESYEKELEDGFASYKEDKLRQEETNRKSFAAACPYAGMNASSSYFRK